MKGISGIALGLLALAASGVAQHVRFRARDFDTRIAGVDMAKTERGFAKYDKRLGYYLVLTGD